MGGAVEAFLQGAFPDSGCFSEVHPVTLHCWGDFLRTQLEVSETAAGTQMCGAYVHVFLSYKKKPRAGARHSQILLEHNNRVLSRGQTRSDPPGTQQ